MLTPAQPYSSWRRGTLERRRPGHTWKARNTSIFKYTWTKGLSHKEKKKNRWNEEPENMNSPYINSTWNEELDNLLARHPEKKLRLHAGGNESLYLTMANFSRNATKATPVRNIFIWKRKRTSTRIDGNRTNSDQKCQEIINSTSNQLTISSYN